MTCLEEQLTSCRITLVVSCLFNQEKINGCKILVLKVQSWPVYRDVFLYSQYKGKFLNQSCVTIWEENFQKCKCCSFGFIHIIFCFISGIYQAFFETMVLNFELYGSKKNSTTELGNVFFFYLLLEYFSRNYFQRYKHFFNTNTLLVKSFPRVKMAAPAL
jgi:hypothetical protein